MQTIKEKLYNFKSGTKEFFQKRREEKRAEITRKELLNAHLIVFNFSNTLARGNRTQVRPKTREKFERKGIFC